MIKSFLKQLFKKHFPKLLLILFLSLITVSCSLLIPVFIGNSIDIIIADSTNTLRLLYQGLGILISTFFICVSSYLNQIVASDLGYIVGIELRKELESKFLNLPLSYLDSHNLGDLSSRAIIDIEVTIDGIVQTLTQGIHGILTLIGSLIIMFIYNVYLSLFVLVLTPLSFFAISFVTKRIASSFNKVQQLQGEIYGFAESYLSSLKGLKSLGNQDIIIDEFKKQNESLRYLGIKSQFYGALINPTSRIVNYLIYFSVGILGLVIHLKYNPLLTLGAITTFLTLTNEFSKPFNEISDVTSILQSSYQALLRILQVTTLPLELDKSFEDNSPLQFENSIEFRNLNFQYKKDVPIISNFNLTVKKGQMVAIVGPTGAGKTTIINLLLRFYEPTSGEILLDSKPLSSLNKKSLRELMGLVLQETWLKEATVKDNIALAKKDATPQEIQKAAELAFADYFIERLPNSYDTLISNQSSLSAGQRQLLSISRVILKNPEILILDEATSSIDTRTEIYVQKAFDSMIAGHTSFIVAHRLGTIKKADIILVMNEGTIVEQGTHEELLTSHGFYEELYNSQFAYQDN